MATSVLWISWVTVLGPTLHDGGGTRFERAIGLAYPASDAVLLTIVIIAFVRCDPAGRVATGFAAIGFASFAVADSLFAYTTLHGNAVSEISNTAWVAGYLLIALGALHATRHPPVRVGELSADRDRSRLGAADALRAGRRRARHQRGRRRAPGPDHRRATSCSGSARPSSPCC